MFKGKSLWKQKLIAMAAEKKLMNIKESPEIATVRKTRISESRVGLVTTAGVHLQEQPVFDVKNGDDSFRLIPDDTPISGLMISHTHYDRTDADQDINCVFPLERLHELEKEGVIGSSSAFHYGFMGYIPKPNNLINNVGPEVAEQLKKDDVDIVILSPG